jgi:4-amino-4-deoxychorismate lyase
MSPFIETIRLHQGEFMHLSYHQERLNRTRRACLGLEKHPDLAAILEVPESRRTGTHKVRVVYGRQIDRVEYLDHHSPRVRSLKLVKDEEIDYRYKYTDRNRLHHLYRQRAGCDDILIVKGGKITDSYMANVVCWDGRTWYTPDTPLLPGTMRAALLDKGLIREHSIALTDLGNYQKFRLINALNPLETSPDIPLSAICS